MEWADEKRRKNIYNRTNSLKEERTEQARKQTGLKSVIPGN